MNFKLFFSLVVAAASATHVFETKIPSVWEMVGEVESNKQVEVTLALQSKDWSAVERTIEEVSFPTSPRFRKYLSDEEIKSLTGRSDEEIAKVRDYIESIGGRVTSVHPLSTSVVATLPVQSLEKSFKCQLGRFENKQTKARKLTCLKGYTLPVEIALLVQLVPGLHTFPVGHLTPIPEVGLGAASQVTPQTIYDVYKTDTSGSHGSKLGSQAILEFGKSANFNEASLQTFFKTYQTSLIGETCGVVYGENNGNSAISAGAGVEADLDVQYIMAAGVFVNTSDYKIVAQNTGDSIQDQFYEYTQVVLAQSQPPLVHSASYGAYGGSYDNTTDQLFSQNLGLMGLKGVTVILASGDNGVGCNSLGTSQEFDYPSSPYLTMVGATYYDLASKTEIGATLSSGGFSLDFSLQSWQADAVNYYLDESGAPMPKESFYRYGRAYPDVAAFGQNVAIVTGGKQTSVSGTSCSAPIFAGIIALLNHERLTAGQSPLGLINPWLYANPQMFTDILSGSNPYEKCEGFEAAKGWDPVTGLGTPLYPAMLAQVHNEINNQTRV